jgi:hypothetical protein
MFSVISPTARPCLCRLSQVPLLAATGRQEARLACYAEHDAVGLEMGEACGHAAIDRLPLPSSPPPSSPRHRKVPTDLPTWICTCRPFIHRSSFVFWYGVKLGQREWGKGGRPKENGGRGLGSVSREALMTELKNDRCPTVFIEEHSWRKVINIARAPPPSSMKERTFMS